MKLVKKIALATALVGSTFAAQQTFAVEVSASAGVANMYLWRGQDLSDGSPAVSGDINVSENGAYAGVWASSGDDTAGQEYDLYVGYGGEVGPISYDVSAVSYIYPESDVGAGDLADVIVGVGYGPVSASITKNVTGDDMDYYYTLGAEAGAFSATLGHADYGETDDVDYTHLDLSYSYNDNLGFTVSQIIDGEKDLDTSLGLDKGDINFVVSYDLPIK